MADGWAAGRAAGGGAEIVDASVTTGRTVAGVRLGTCIGRGSTGQVWAGTDLVDGTRVAVKLLSGAPADVDVALAQGAGHPHVLQVRRVHHDPPAVVTVLAGGGSLAAQVQARGCLRPAEVVTVLAPLADALAWLHARGAVHGDVSATNVLFVERGRPVLGDLGSASLAGGGPAFATPGFAAPEVLAGAPPSPAADVHGLAAVGWLALTGSVPPAAQDRLPLRLLAPECPDELVEAVTSGLDPDPARRPTPLELAAAARTGVEAEPVGLVPSAALGIRADEAVTYRVRSAAALDRAGLRPSRRTWGRAPWSRGRDVLGPGPGPGSRRPARRAAVAAGVAVVVGALVLSAVVLLPWPHRSDEPAAVGTATVTPAPLEQVVLALVEARQTALRSGDAGLLTDVHHPDGTTLTGDRDLLADGPVDVTYRVLSVEPGGPAAVGARPGAATDGPVTAAVRLTTTTDGSPEMVEDLLVELDRHQGRWLVRRVSR